MSKRFEDTPNLFGVNGGVCTGYELKCEWCGVVHNPGADADEKPMSEGDSVSWTGFGGKQVCDCCFHEIENAVLNRMPDILPWLVRIIASREKHSAKMREMLDQVATALEEQK